MLSKKALALRGACEADSSAGGDRCLFIADSRTGLRAIIAIDSLVLGPAVGGIRTLRYPSDDDALSDVVRLAAAMTLKCSIAGLDAGGGKTVVLADQAMDRAAAFRRLGEFIDELGGLYCAAGDMGTTQEDLDEVASATAFVDTDGASLAEAGARGVLRCIEACAELHGRDAIAGLRVAVQGCGAMGAAVARALASAGADVRLADHDPIVARNLAHEIGGSVAAPDEILLSDVDVIAPCAIGGVITHDVARRIRAWAICGAANNQTARPSADAVLADRRILYVPDFLASAGAVIHGVAVRGGHDAASLIDALRTTTLTVLSQANRLKRPSAAVAAELARDRIAARTRENALRGHSGGP